MQRDSSGIALANLHACEDAYLAALAHPDPTGSSEREEAIEAYRYWSEQLSVVTDSL